MSSKKAKTRTHTKPKGARRVPIRFHGELSVGLEPAIEIDVRLHVPEGVLDSLPMIAAELLSKRIHTKQETAKNQPAEDEAGANR